MKNNSLLMLSALFLLGAQEASAKTSQNLWQPRDFSSSMYDLFLLKPMYKSIESKSHWAGTLSLAPRYSQSFGTCNSLGALPFWSGTNSMTYGTNNGLSTLDAYYFGLGQNVPQQGTITLIPKVVQAGSDILLCFAEHLNKRGFYFKINAPVAATSVTAKLCEKNASYDTADDISFQRYPAPDSRPKSMTEAFQSGFYDGADESHSSVNHTLRLDFGRIANCKMSIFRFDDIKLSLGYKVHVCEKGFLDLGVKASCPTGNVPTALYALEPIVGKSGHWGFGVEAVGYRHVWESDDLDKGINLWAQAEIMHLFPGRRPSWRSFDLKQNGKGSKYILVQHYAPVNLRPDGSRRRAGIIDQAINITTLPVRSKFGVEASLAVLGDFYWSNWNAALGVELYARSRECISIDHCQSIKNESVNLNDYAVLGRQINADSNPAALTVANTYVDLYLCEPLATINKSENRVTVANAGAGPLPAGPVTTNPASYDTNKIKDARIASNRIPANYSDALDICGAAAPRMFNGKVAAQVGYTFVDCCYSPNLSIIGDATFSDCNSCNFWSVGAQGSINF